MTQEKIKAETPQFVEFLDVVRRITEKDIDFTVGPKYIRVITLGYGQRSAYCFVDRATGSVLKPASWKSPAPQPRGSILSADRGADACTKYGVVYLR